MPGWHNFFSTVLEDLAPGVRLLLEEKCQSFDLVTHALFEI